MAKEKDDSPVTQDMIKHLLAISQSRSRVCEIRERMLARATKLQQHEAGSVEDIDKAALDVEAARIEVAKATIDILKAQAKMRPDIA